MIVTLSETLQETLGDHILLDEEATIERGSALRLYILRKGDDTVVLTDFLRRRMGLLTKYEWEKQK